MALGLPNNKPPYIYYPGNVRIVYLCDPFSEINDSKDIERNNLSTQQFLYNNEWYTKIFYRGMYPLYGKHTNEKGTSSYLINNIENCVSFGGVPKYSKLESKEVFISGMKGFRMPILDINPPSDITTRSYYLNGDGHIDGYSIPCPPDYYITEPLIKEDYCPYLITDLYNLPIYGIFESNINNPNILDNLNYIYTNNVYRYKGTRDIRVEYPSITIKGYFTGFGGTIQERCTRDIVNTIVDNNKGFVVKRVTQVEDITDNIYI
jgi:hypothetical protein